MMPHGWTRLSSQVTGHDRGRHHRHLNVRDRGDAVTLIHQSHRRGDRHDLKPPVTLDDLQRLSGSALGFRWHGLQPTLLAGRDASLEAAQIQQFSY